MATRFYYQASNAPTVSPPLDAGWGSTANMVRRLMGTAQQAATETISGAVADGASALAVQLISPPLAAQNIAGLLTLMSRGKEGDISDNVNKRFRAVRVYSGDGTTLRGTLIAYNATSSTTELSATTLQGQIHAQNNGVAALDVLAGDILVIEVGYGVSTTGTSPPNNWDMAIGGTGTDHGVSNADVTGTVPWLEFSQTLVLQAATVTLTPATVSLAAMFTATTPGPVTTALTVATVASTAVAVTATAGSITVALTPATATRAAVAVTPTPLSTGAILTPATATLTARATTATPGPVTTAILPGLMSSAPVAVQPQPGVVTVTLTTATATLTARATTVSPGVTVLALTPATATASARTVTLSLGVTVMTLTPAAVLVTALDFGVTPGLVNVNLTAATVTVAARQTTPAGVGTSSLTLTPATTVAVGVPITAHPGLVLTPLTVATVTLAGTALTLTPGPVATALTAATVTLTGVSVTAAPGLVTMSLAPAAGAWSGATLDLTLGELTTTTVFATATWTAVPVIPAPVEGVLLRPALATLTGRKLTPKGSVLPLNTYELPLARVLLDCLTEVLIARTDNPPQHFSLRVGEQVPFDLSQNQDLCCEGLAYVKINRVYPATNFPNEDEATWSPCGPLAWAADLEMGILRCAPVGDTDYIPTDAEWTDATDVVANDSAAMRMAIACFRDRVEPGTEWVARSWLPIGPVGACTGGSQIVTVGWIPC